MFLIFVIVDRAVKDDDTVLVTWLIHLKFSRIPTPRNVWEVTLTNTFSFAQYNMKLLIDYFFVINERKTQEDEWIITIFLSILSILNS